MRSRTSFCNGNILKKDITRFFPLWAVFGVFMAVWAFNNSTILSLNYNPAQVAYSLSRNIQNVQVLFLVYGFGCATLLFGDLFRPRMCNALHAMPLRRECWFFTHVVAGILFVAVPAGVVALLMAILLQEYAFVAFFWWLAVTGQVLFHFALAVLCVMLSGNLLGHGAVFGTISFFPMLVNDIYSIIYEPMLYGISLESRPFEFVTPAQHWAYQEYLNWDIQNAEMAAEAYSYDKVASAPIVVTETKYIFQGFDMQAWLYLGVCMLLAVGFFALAVVLYRRRKLECAGDFMTSPVVLWVFLILGSMYAGIAVPVVGFIIGFFGILMLAERRLKVFSKKNLIAFGVTAAAVALTLGLTYWDVTGITTKVPEANQVQAVTLNPQWVEGSMRLDDPEDIQAVMTAHEYALANREPEDGNWYHLELEYTLEDGSTMHRVYTMNAQVPALDGIKEILSRWDVVFEGRDMQSLMTGIYEISLYVERLDEEGYYITSRDVIIPAEDYGKLLEAIWLDCQEGTMSQNSAFHEGQLQSLNIRYKDVENMGSRSGIHIFEDSAHTMAFLQQYLQ